MVLGLLTLFAPAIEAGSVRFLGHAYERDGSRYLYTEVHVHELEGERWLRGRVEYLAPDGSVLGRKQLRYEQHSFVPFYELTMPATGVYVEGIRNASGGFELYRRDYGARAVRRQRIEGNGLVAAESGVHALLREHFAELLKGQAVAVRLLVPSRLTSYRFRVRRLRDGRFAGRPVVRFRLEPNSLLRLLFADAPLEFSYEPDTRRLREYRGPSDIHDPGTRKPYNVRVIYPDRPPPDAPALPVPEAR